MRAATSTLLFGVLLAIVLGPATARAKVDVKVDFDKAFSFTGVKTWAWNPTRPGEVKMARFADDDPEAMRERAEPIIIDAVTNEMGRRGLRQDLSAPDVTIAYYLLLTTTMTAQTIGQFVPATTEWGLPPMTGATQSLEMMNQGSLVLDLSAGDRVVWRGAAQARIKVDVDDKKREALIREAVRDLLRRFPPRS
jgi:hypothetical protein